MEKARMARWVAAAMLAASAAAQAATCPASNEAALLACIAGASSGDTVSIGAPIALSGAPLVVNSDIMVSGSPLGGSLLKRGPGMLRLASANTFDGVSLEGGTIGLDTSASLVWAAGGQFHMRGGKLLSLNPGSITTNGGFFLFSDEGSTVAAPAGGTLTIQAGFQISNVTATFGEPANPGTVSILVPGSVGVGVTSSAIHVAAGDFTLDSTVIPATVLPTLMNGLQLVTIDAGATLAAQAPLDLKELAGGGGLANPLGVTLRGGTFAGFISGPGGLAIASGATVTLTGASTYAGATTITGTLNLGDGNTSGSLPGSSLVTFAGNGDFVGTSGPTLNVNRSDAYTMANNFAGGGNFVMLGGGEVRLTGSSTRAFAATKAQSGTITVANPAFAAGGGGVINAFLIDGGRLHFSEDTPDVRIIARATGRVTVATGKSINVITLQILDVTSAYTFGDAVSGGTVVLAPFGLGYRTDFTTDFTVEGGTVRLANASLQDPTRYFRTTTVRAPGVLEATALARVRNLRGDGTLRAISGIFLSGPTDFAGRFEGAGNIDVIEPAIYRGDGSAYTGQLGVDAQLRLGGGGTSGILGAGEILVNQPLIIDRSDSFTMSNRFTGGGPIAKNGAGTLTLDGASPATTSTLTATAGALSLTGSFAGTIANSARLLGTGSAGAVNSSGSFAPGLSPGVFTTDALDLASGTFEIEINGPAAGTQYDQVRANAGATVGGTLAVALGYAPAPGDIFRIVDNLGGAATAGTFAGLAEGALVTAGAVKLRISYAGGTGNDVTLTAIAVPSAPAITNVTLPTTSSAMVTFTPPAFDGLSPVLDYTAQCGATTATGPASPITVAGLPAGPVTCVVRARNAAGTSVDSAPFLITPGRFTFSGATPTGTGNLTASLAGGGGACEFTVAPSLVPLMGDPLSPPAGTAPESVLFPHGLFAFDASGCTAGSTLTLTLVYPQPLPTGTRYWKYGPTAASPAPHWYVVPATISGNTVMLSIVDGGLGDDDLVANGAVSDPGGPGVFVPPPPRAAAPAAAYQALWWAGPQESGWGINTTHQGNVLFATWFTYNANGEGQWFLMSRAERTAPGVFTGTIYTTRGPAFNAAPFDPQQVVVTEVGTGTFTFSSPTSGTFDYTVNGITQSKALVRTEFGNAIPECTAGGPAPAIVNYQDTWWNASESGWGLNITHQGDLIFATWFTYDTSGKAQWLLMSNVRRVGFSDQFAGSIYRVRGNPFNTLPWNLGSIETAEVGRVTLTFGDRDHATFAYTLDGVSQVKDITRQEFASPKATCRFP